MGDWSLALFLAWLATAVILFSATYLYKVLGHAGADRGGAPDGHAAGGDFGADADGRHRRLACARQARSAKETAYGNRDL